MIFTVDEATSGDYRRRTGDKLPTEIEFKTLTQLMAWIERCENPIVITAGDDISKPDITIYNGYLE